MASLHQLNCTTNRRNTGYGGCPVDWKLISGAFLFDNPAVFYRSDLANLQTVLQNLAWSDTKSNRLFPIHKFVNPTDNTEAPVIQTFADGSKAKVRDGVYDWAFQFTSGGFCLQQALRTHIANGSAYAMFYDKERKILATTNNGELAPIPLQIFDAEPWKMNTGQATAIYQARFVYATNYANEDAEYTQADFNLEQIVGLQDVKIQVLGFNHTTGMVSVALITECGGTNLYDLYSTNFVSATWLATNAATGAAIPITSVTPIASSKTFNIILNAANGNYPTSNSIYLNLAVPSVLNANGIAGYEGEQATLTVVNS